MTLHAPTPGKDLGEAELDSQTTQLSESAVEQGAVRGVVEPAADAAGVGQGQVEAAVAGEDLADGFDQRAAAEEGVDGHFADEQDYRRLKQFDLTVKKAAAQRDLGVRRRAVAVTGRRLAWEAARQRRQVHVAAKIARWKTGPVEPALEEAARWASEVVPLAVGDRAGRLADEHEARLVDQARADGIGVRQVPS